MKRFISACAMAAAFAATAYAQDSTTTTRTQVKADDAKAITATGCLVPGLAPGVFSLRGTIIARGEEVSSKTRTETEVDRDSTRTRTETRTEAEGDRNRVRRGTAIVYDLSPRAGVDLTPHIGQQVQVTAILLDRGKGDADVTVKEETRVDGDNEREGRSRTETRLRVDREDGPRLNVISVKGLGQKCS
jgi:hypothetical protein